MPGFAVTQRLGTERSCNPIPRKIIQHAMMNYLKPPSIDDPAQHIPSMREFKPVR